MADIVEDIASLYGRIGGLETNVSNPESIIRIQKIYTNLLLQTKITIKRKAALFPSDSLFPSDDLFM